jgi:hypothetical protein
VETEEWVEREEEEDEGWGRGGGEGGGGGGKLNIKGLFKATRESARERATWNME